MSKEITERLKSNLKEVGHDIADLGSQAANKISEVTHSAKEAAREMPERTREALGAAAKKTDNFVKEKPYHALGIAALVGAAIGAAIKRK